MARLLGGLSSRGTAAAGSCTRRGHTTHAVGGLGLRSASRTAPGAFWASRADALPMIQARLPIMANAVMEASEGNAQGCIGELQESTRVLDASVLLQSQSQHGWQYYASSSLEHHFRETVVFAQSSADLAHLRSHAGPGASAVHVVTTSLPHNDLGTITAPIGHCRSSLRVRWFRRQFGKAPCSMSTVGSFAFSCSGAGENFSARLPGSRRCGSVQREVEVLASGLPLEHGAQLAVDVTLRSRW